MRSVKIWGLIVCFTTAVFSVTAFIGSNKVDAKENIVKSDATGFAVLELFTSEGCSSCPPADQLLARLEKESEGKAVYLLAYHVDYWDRQGWKDTYSNAAFSNRQIQYGGWLGRSQIYTPQVIVNGKAEFLGSDESAIRKAISLQLAAGAGVRLMLQAHQDSDGLKVQYQVSQVAKSSRLLIAILQKAAQTKVERGENAGHMLSHVQIVHKLQIERLSTTGESSSIVMLPKGFNSKNWEVVGFIQDQNSGEILSAARADLTDTVSSKK